MTASIDSLIVVPGHAPFKDSVELVPDDFHKDEYWMLQGFQKGEPAYYVEHIKAGAQLAKDNKSSLPIFSGGRTRAESKNWSEAATYKAIYDKLGYDSPNVELEKYARDSFENLEFSLYHFYSKIGHYPEHITVIGWKFKQERFDFHAKTLGIAADRFTYVGVNSPEDEASALRGEQKALASFKLDPFGTASPLLDKKLERNPFGDKHPYGDLPPILS